jgi:hypothetical protein
MKMKTKTRHMTLLIGKYSQQYKISKGYLKIITNVKTPAREETVRLEHHDVRDNNHHHIPMTKQ